MKTTDDLGVMWEDTGSETMYHVGSIVVRTEGGNGVRSIGSSDAASRGILKYCIIENHNSLAP